jgi:prenyltransferase beta subunit
MEPEKNETFVKKLQDKLAASRFFTFSLLLHVVLVILGGSAVLFHQMTPPPDFVSEGGEGGLISESQVQAPPEPQEMTPQAFTPVAPQVNAPQLAALTTTNTTTSTFQVQAAVPVMKPTLSDNMSQAMTNVSTMTRGIGSGLPGTMSGRAGGTARAAAMRQMGGKEKSEKAVMAGLRWLVKQQKEDGSWSPEHSSAMTGLAILCFLGHGETPASPEFGPTVKKAIDWMIAKGTEFEGRLSLTKGGWGGHSGVYAHGIAAYALAEYYTMTKDDRVIDVLKQSIKYIVDGQAPDGGWQYSFAKGPDSDTSVSGWQVQALKAAHLTGLNMEGVDAALDKAMLNFKRVQRSDGGFGYTTASNGNGYSLSGVGVLCTYFWKGNKDELVRDGIKNIMEKTEKDWPVEYKGDKADLYAWYYHTQACLMFGGSAWTKWNRWFQDEIVDAQSGDGSWPPLGGKSPGGELQRKPDGGGPYYRTTLAILMLEVYYRYMPTTK